MDIGTGKLPGGEVIVNKKDDYWLMDNIKVWMYDVVAPDERFNLYEYVVKAEKIIDEISSSEKLPILVGGTGLYIRSLLEGVLEFGADENEDLRLELEDLETEEIKEKINHQNPEVLKNLNNSELNNKRRLIRLYEKLITSKNQNSFTGIEKDFDILSVRDMYEIFEK